MKCSHFIDLKLLKTQEELINRLVRSFEVWREEHQQYICVQPFVDGFREAEYRVFVNYVRPLIHTLASNQDPGCWTVNAIVKTSWIRQDGTNESDWDEERGKYSNEMFHVEQVDSTEHAVVQCKLLVEQMILSSVTFQSTHAVADFPPVVRLDCGIGPNGAPFLNETAVPPDGTIMTEAHGAKLAQFVVRKMLVPIHPIILGAWPRRRASK